MQTLPECDGTVLVRTDFTDQFTWAALREQLCARFAGPGLTVLDDPGWDGTTADDLIDDLSDDHCRPTVALADHRTMVHPEAPVQIVDLATPAQFRVATGDMWIVDSCLRSGVPFVDLAADVDDGWWSYHATSYLPTFADLMARNRQARNRPGIDVHPALTGGLPAGDRLLVVRADQSDDTGWDALCAALDGRSAEPGAVVDYLAHPRFAGTTPRTVRAVPVPSGGVPAVFLADRETVGSRGASLLAVDMQLWRRTLRVVPAEFAAVAVNLDLANMELTDFTDAADPDGIFRGFRGAAQR